MADEKQQIYTATAAAEYLAVAPDTLRHWGQKVPHHLTVGGHRRYRLADLEAAVQTPPDEPAGLVSTDVAARRLGVTAHTLRAWTAFPHVTTGRGHRRYRVSDLEAAEASHPPDLLATIRQKLAEVLALLPSPPTAVEDRHEARRQSGYYSVSEVAERCGVQRISIQHHTKAGRFSPPTHEVQGFRGRYYSRAEAEAIAEVMRERRGFGTAGRRGPRQK